MNACRIMFPEGISVDSDIPTDKFEEMLILHQTKSLDSVRHCLPSTSDILVCNLFDCLDDTTYTNFIRSLPSKW